MCTFVVCFKWGAGMWLFMPNFIEGSYDGSAVLTTRVNSYCFGFCGRSDYILKRLSKDIHGSVDAIRVINPSEMVMYGNAAASFGLHEVRDVGRYLEDHVAGVEANDGVGMCVEVFHEPVGLFHGL